MAEALRQGPLPPGNLAVPIFAHGTLAVELYTPQGSDPQQPYDRDEVYLIARGRGLFFDGTSRRAVEPGTFLFVAAGQAHRFEEFSPGLRRLGVLLRSHGRRRRGPTIRTHDRARLRLRRG